MFCTNCGKQIPDDSIFCPECGTRVVIPNMTRMPEVPSVPEVPQPQQPQEDKTVFYDQPNPSSWGPDQPTPSPIPTPAPNPQEYGKPSSYNQGFDEINNGRQYQELPAVSIVRKYVGGGAFLTMAICLSIAMLMAFIQTASVYKLIRYSFYDDTARAVSIAILMVTIIMMLMLVLGVWMMWGSARSYPSEIKGTGLVKAWAIVLAVLIGLTLAVNIYYLAFELPQEYEYYFELVKRLDASERAHLRKELFKVFLPYIVSLLVTFLYFLYFVKIAIAADRIRNMSWYGNARKKIPALISVMNVLHILLLLICIFFLIFAADELRMELLEEYYYYSSNINSTFGILIVSLIINIVMFACFIVVNSSINGEVKRVWWGGSQILNDPPGRYHRF